MFNWKTRECVQEVLALTFALFLMFALAAPAQAFFPIGIAIGGAMVGGAMQAERQQSQQSEQYQRREQYQRSEQYQRNEDGAESKHTKKTNKAKNHKRERDVKIAKAKAPEPVVNAPQAKPLRADSRQIWRMIAHRRREPRQKRQHNGTLNVTELPT